MVSLICPKQDGSHYMELRIAVNSGQKPCDVCGMPKEWHAVTCPITSKICEAVQCGVHPEGWLFCAREQFM